MAGGSTTQMSTPESIVRFWRHAGRGRWFKKDLVFDRMITAHFASLHEDAKRGDLDHWACAPHSLLALIILLDQFARNIYRGSALAFAADTHALALSHEAVGRGFDMAVNRDLRAWLYMPMMHSERMPDQTRCIELAKRSGLDGTYRFAVIHAEIIEKFGRFPHRNKVLGRETTMEEAAFLKSGGFSG